MPLGYKICQDDPNKKAFAEGKVHGGTYIVLCPSLWTSGAGDQYPTSSDTRSANFSSMSSPQNALDYYTGSLFGVMLHEMHLSYVDHCKHTISE